MSGTQDPSLRNRLWRWVQPLTEWPVVHANPNAPRPAGRHIALRIVSSPLPDHNGTRIDETDPEAVKFVGQGISVVEMQFFGAGCMGEAERFSLQLGAQQAIETGALLELALGRRLGLRDMTAARQNAQFEPRALLEFEVLWLIGGTESRGRILQVITTSNVGGATALPNQPPWQGDIGPVPADPAE